MPEPDHFHANLQRGTLLLNQNRPREALPFLQAAIAANPEAPEGYAELARCYNAIPAERRKTIPAIDRAIALAPNNSRYFGLKGWYLVCLLQHHAALQTAKQGLALNPVCPLSMNALANAYTKLGQWKNAEAACRRILSLNPDDGPGLNLLAQALRHQGRWKETREAVARLLANMPNNAFGHANAGYAALAAGDHLRANEHFLTSLQMDPHFDLARRGLIASLRARIWIVRLNTRISYALQRPDTFGYRAVKIFGGIGLLVALFCLSGFVNQLYPPTGIYLLGTLFYGFIFYLFLSGIIGMIGNLLLLFDPVGRHALTRRDKILASLPAVAFVLLISSLLSAGQWKIALGFTLFFALLALTIQFPLLKDRWLRRREKAFDP